jgi:hypothetical protein
MARRRQIGRGWGNDFGREPDGVYAAKERERTATLVTAAMEQKYGESGGIPSLGQMSRAAFIEYDRKNDPYVQAGLPPLPTQKKDKNKGPFGGLKSISGKAMSLVNDAAQDVYIRPNMAAAKGIMAGLEKVDAISAATPAALFTRGEVNAQGQYGTKRNLVGNPISNVQSHIRAQQQAGYDTGGNPVVAGVKAQMRAGRAFQRDEDIAPGIRIGATAAANPLSYAGPGTIGKLPLIRRSAQAGGIAGAIFETPLALTATATAGAAGAAQWGEHIPGLKEVPEEYRPLVGGVIGGLGPGGLKYAARKARNIRPQDLLEEAPAPAVTRRVPEGEKFRHGTVEEFEGLPEPRGGYGHYFGKAAYSAKEGSRTPDDFAQFVPEGFMRPGDPPRAKEGSRVIPMRAKRDVDLLLDDEAILPEELDRIRGVLTDEEKRAFDNRFGERFYKDSIRGTDVRSALTAAVDEDGVPEVISRAGFGGWEADYGGGDMIQGWVNPERDLRSEFELPEVPKPKPTVKRPSLFGEVEDTMQTEAELNGWREQQGDLFDRGAPVAKPKPAPKGQRSLFDLFDEGQELAVAPRRQRMAGQEGNQPVRMRGDQIAEALGKSPEDIAEYKRLDQSVRDASGKPDTKHPNFPRREDIRKAWTQEYVDRNGRQPVILEGPGARANRYAEIDRRVAAGEPTTDTGGEFEGFFDTDSARRSRIMQLEKIASDPSVKPEMRARARQKLAEEQGAELTGRQPGDTGFIPPEEPGLGRSILKAATGPSSPAALAARAGYGFASAKLEGEDNSEALKRSVLAAMPAGVGRAALRATGGLDEAKILGAVARSGDDAADGPKVSLKAVDLAHNEITEKPELFQGRDADPGLTYKESRVQSIMEKFDPNRLEPGLVAKDVNTGEHVVIRGHHRLEVMKRKAAAGELADRSDWQVIEADLTNPADVNTLKRMARVSNFSTAETNLREKLDAVRILREDGEDIGSIQQELRMSSTEIDDLDAIDRGIPDDLVDRLTEMGKTQQESAAEIAKIALRYNLKEADVRAAVARYVINPEKALTRAKVRASMEAGAQAFKEAEAVGLQGGLFGDDAQIETVLRAVDELKAKEDLILKAKREAASLVSKLTKRYQGDPRGDFEGMARAIIDDAQADIVKLELEIEELKTNFNNRNRPAAVEEVADVIDATPRQTGPDMFGGGMEEPAPAPELPAVPARETPQALPDLLRTEGRVITGTGEGQVGDLLARAPSPEREVIGAPELGPRDIGTEGAFSEPEWPQRPGAPRQEPTIGAEAPEFEDLRYSPAAEMGERGAVPGAGRAAGQEPLGDVLAPEDIGRTGPVPTAGRAAGQQPLGDVLAPEGRRDVIGAPRPGPNEGQQAGLAHVGEGERTRYTAEIDTAEAERINQEWAGISAEVPKVKESGGYFNKILIEWPAAASRAMFTASTSGDLGSGLIQGAYQAWTHPVAFAKSFTRSLHSFVSESAREGARQHVRNIISEAAPEHMRATVFDDVFKAGGAFSKRPEEYITDVGSAPLEKIPVAGAFFRGTRRQFETQTELMRAQALANMMRNQRTANIAAGLGDVIQPDQLHGAVNIANHLTGATKMGMNPVAGIVFGAPRFMMSQFALIQDAFTKGGVSGAYARRELIKTFGMIASTTAAANLLQSRGKDTFGPGLGNPQDIKSYEDFKEIITSPNFGRVRVGDSDISLFGPLDPLARTFFQELANAPDVAEQLGLNTRGVGKAEEAEFPGSASVNFIENKASPLTTAVLAVKAGEDKFTGEQYEDFGDYFMDNMERVLPIFSQNALDAFQGKGSWVSVGAEFVGLKSSPTTPYERAVGILDSIPGEYWVVDAKNNQLRPPNTIYELSPKQREALRKEHPEIDNYLTKRENDPNKTFIQKLGSEYASAQSVWDAQLTNGQMTTDAWRRQFIGNQKQLRTLREQAETAGEDFEPTTQRDVDLDSYFGIWDDPAVDGEKGLDYEEAERQINALRTRVGETRWAALKETLAWNKSPIVTQYLTDMQQYNEFIANNSKYEDVPPERTRAVDKAVTRVRQLQASNPGLQGKYALYDMRDKGEIDEDTMYAARTAIARKYSDAYSEWKASEDGERITAWFRPQIVGDVELIDVLAAQPSGSSGGGLGSRGKAKKSSGRKRPSFAR